MLAAPAPVAAPRPSASLRVLVIDDYVDATRALERLLGVMGHQVIIAHDGKSGIELAERVRPDVILLDIGLPEMDGYSVARHLRSLPSMAATRIIALTGYGAERARRDRPGGRLRPPSRQAGGRRRARNRARRRAEPMTMPSR